MPISLAQCDEMSFKNWFIKSKSKSENQKQKYWSYKSKGFYCLEKYSHFLIGARKTLVVLFLSRKYFAFDNS